MPKKSKEEIAAEKAAAAEEERRLAEIERERQERLKGERVVMEARIVSEKSLERKTELDRLAVEYMNYTHYKVSREMKKAFDDVLYKAELEWEKTCNPTDIPEATSEKDINTLITSSRQMFIVDMQEALENVQYLEKVAKDVENVWSDAIASGEMSLVSIFTKFIEQLSEIIVSRFDSATAHYLRFVDRHLNDKSEINVEESSGMSSIGFWGSMSDMRPIRKSIQFESLGIQMDVPKQILQQDSRFVHRVIKVPFDIDRMAIYYSPERLQNKIDKVLAEAAAAKNTVEGETPPTEETATEGDGEEKESAVVEEKGPTSKEDEARKNELISKIQLKQVLSDTMTLDILVPPPQAYEIRSKMWVVRDKSSNAMNLVKHSYPSTVGTKCFIKIPDDIMIDDDVAINFWDEEKKEWTDEGIQDYLYSEPTRMCQFSITSLGTLALVKSRATAFPYKSWTLNVAMSYNSPEEKALVFEKQAVFTIHAGSYTVKINIKGNKVSLAEAFDISVTQLVDQYMSVGQLLSQLQKRGLNILPADVDIKLLEYSIGKCKDSDLEDDIYVHMSQCANTFDFASTEWNQDLDDAHIGLLARESTVYTATGEAFDYECILVEKDDVALTKRWVPDQGSITGTGPSKARFTSVVGNHYGNRPGFDNAARSGELAHIELLESLRSTCTPEAYERVRKSEEAFASAVYTLLRLVKPISLTRK